MSAGSTGSNVGGVDVVKRGLLAAVLAVLANGTVLWIARSTGVAADIRAFRWSSVLALTVIGVVGATGVYWLVRRRGANPDRTFVRIAAIALLVSFVPDVGLYLSDPAATAPAVGVLMTMHAIAAAISVGVLTGRALPGRPN